MMRSAILLVALATGSTSAFVAAPTTTTTFRTLLSPSSSTLLSASSSTTKVKKGSIVTVECELKPEGDFVPDPVVDTNGCFTFVLGGGNYLPGLHDLVQDMAVVGDKVENMSIDGGWGSRNPNLIAKIQKEEMGNQIDVNDIKVGVELALVNGMKAVVTEVTDDAFTIDANPPLAGSSYTATVELLAAHEAPTELGYIPEGVDSKYHVATFALGCFWGSELAYMRKDGVVGTQVGYTQGSIDEPTYQQVCAGTTGHTEANLIYYDPEVVTYRQLVELTMDRLGENKFKLNQVGNDRGTQYRHGIYYHNDAQKEIAEDVLRSFGPDCQTEVLPAKKFWVAEDYHQQYLLKGGQSARKGDESTIRCYG